MLLGYGYMRNNLVSLGDILLTEMLLICQISFIFILCLYDQGRTRLPRFCLSKQNSMNKNQYKHFRQPVETKIMQMRMYQFKLTKYLFLSRGYEHVSSLARWSKLYIDTKILLSQTTYQDIFSI